MRGRFRAGSIVLSFVFLLGSSALGWAQSSDAHGDWDFSVFATIETGEEHLNSFAEAQIVTAGVFAGKILTREVGHGWRRGRFEYGMDGIPLFRQVRPQAIYGAGFEPVILRWNFARHPGGLAPYIELAGGGVRTNTNLPTGDTSNFNFTARGGGGIQIFTRPRRSIDIACRWSHVSNANLGVKNPEFNGVQVSIGYHWFK